MTESRGSRDASPTREDAPLLSAQNQTAHPDLEASEATPLLSRPTEDSGASQTRRSSAASLLKSIQNDGKSRRRWPSLIALLLLCAVVIVIMVLGFLTPEAIHEYAMEAAKFEPTSLSIQEFTATGVRARVRGEFSMDASKVKKQSVRNLGRLGTFVAAKVETGQSFVEVSLPEYGNVVLGTAEIPPIVVDVRNGQTTHVDIVADLTPGDYDGIRRIAKGLIGHRIGQLRVMGKAQVPLKSGLISLGEQAISQSLLFENNDIPKLPQYDIKKIQFHDIDLPGKEGAVAADAKVVLKNDYPVDIRLPPLGFEVLAANCHPDQPRIKLAYVSSEPLHVSPHKDIEVDLLGVVHKLPQDFTTICPDKKDSPMDQLVGNYIHGKDVTVYVRGSSAPSDKVPKWISDMVSEVTVPVSVPGHTFGHLIRNFSLADVHFGLPDPMADEDSPEANPTISAVIKAIIALPEQMNLNLSVHNVRADADVFYKGKKLGKLDLQKWQDANSTMLETKAPDGSPELLVESRIDKAPLEITDDNVFTEVVQALLFGGSRIVLGIQADVDVKLETALGVLTVRKVPAEGRVPVKPIGKKASLATVKPSVGQLQILDTTKTSLTLSALVNFTNPTDYSASLSYVDIQLWKNGSVLGHGTIQHVQIKPGNNTNIPVIAVWDPLTMGGPAAHQVGIDFLSQFISGFNTTITVRTHAGTIPSQPALGRALAAFPIEIPTPDLLSSPDDGEDDEDPDPSDPHPDDLEKKKKGPHFISDGTMHLLSSSATFTLHSPLRTSTLYITDINATALYKGDKVGHIDYDLPFAIPPSIPVVSPSLPVDWSLGSVGYDAIRHAVGGSLKLSAEAIVGVKLGLWEERICSRFHLSFNLSCKPGTAVRAVLGGGGRVGATALSRRAACWRRRRAWLRDLENFLIGTSTLTTGELLASALLYHNPTIHAPLPLADASVEQPHPQSTTAMAGGHMKYRTLSRHSAHRQALLRNLVTALFKHESITTTWAKAKEAQRMADKLVTLGKRNTEAAKNKAKGIFYEPTLLPKLFTTIRQRYLTRPGGYTRVLRLEPQREDQSPSAILELVDSPRDTRFALTARTLATQRRLSPSSTPNELTQGNMLKVTRFRDNGSEELEEMVKKFEWLDGKREWAEAEREREEEKRFKEGKAGEVRRSKVPKKWRDREEWERWVVDEREVEGKERVYPALERTRI
ncbi:hypothetical protein KVT40_001204 [Elsinoe batatas]|uniref:Large ribosomal subunit protein bL17m n=1 Tax=Elsinoe batatas TaxID=2601811 RepID=A0A8K0LBH9_9PEZI|nr:hypothetical protein KVT40_001204 [Elsinoe batatas]